MSEKMTVWFREFQDGGYELGIFDGSIMDVGVFAYSKMLADHFGQPFLEKWTYIGDFE